MLPLERIKLIQESELKQEFYFHSFFQVLCDKNLIAPSAVEQIQLGLIDLLSKEVDRFTNWESSSVPVEKAQDILRSVTYSIGVYLKSITDIQCKIDILTQESMTTLFYRGMEEVSKLKNECKDLLDWNIKNYKKVNHIAYQDTILEGLPLFFHDYNIEFSADEMAGSIDYQLFHSVEGLIGVEYIHEYLTRLKLENEFLLNFQEFNIERLMKAFHKDCEHMLINLFELVITNALGCEMVGVSITELVIRESDLEWLIDKLTVLKKEEIIKLLMITLERLRDKLPMQQESVDYFKASLPELAGRISSNLQHNTLNQIFITNEVVLEELEYFEDGIPMEDEELRKLIEELEEITFIPDKLARIREAVSNMEDWKDILSESFYGDELIELFHLLTDKEKHILDTILHEEAGLEELSDYVPDQEWKKIFLQLDK